MLNNRPWKNRKERKGRRGEEKAEKIAATKKDTGRQRVPTQKAYGKMANKQQKN